MKNLKKLLLIAVLFLICQLGVLSVVEGQNIGINEPNPDNSALMEMTSTERGLLVPRMTTTERNAIILPAESVLIFNTTTKCFEYYYDGGWYSLGCTCTLPDITVATTGSGATSTQITANWDTTAGATNYYIDVSTANDFSSFVTGYDNLNVGNVTTYDITGLTCDSTYYYRIRAENSCGISGNSNAITYITATCFTCGTTTVDDIDGNTYNTVLIGSQCWLKEPMRTTKYPDNSPITKGPVPDGDPGWNNTDLGYYSCPPNASNNGEDCAAATSLGLLYQWSAAMDGAASCNGTGSSQPECTTPVQGICPDGWHIPSHYEWVKLEQQICSDNGGGTCNTDFPYDATTTGWLGTNGEGSDMAGNVAAQNWAAGALTSNGNFDLSGLDLGPSGYRGATGFYFNRSNGAYLWPSTEKDATNTWRRALYYTLSGIARDPNLKGNAFSVRCIKD